MAGDGIVSVKLMGGDEVLAALARMADAMPELADRAALAGAQVVEGDAKRASFYQGSKGEAQGPPKPDKLTSRTGNLRGSIRSQPLERGVAAVGPTAVYGAIHEFGGTINMPAMSRLQSGRSIKVAKLLKSGKYSGKQTVSASQLVRAHTRSAYTIKMPARPYLRPAFERQSVKVRSVMVDQFARGLAEAMNR